MGNFINFIRKTETITDAQKVYTFLSSDEAKKYLEELKNERNNLVTFITRNSFNKKHRNKIQNKISGLNNQIADLLFYIYNTDLDPIVGTELIQKHINYLKEQRDDLVTDLTNGDYPQNQKNLSNLIQDYGRAIEEYESKFFREQIREKINVNVQPVKAIEFNLKKL